MSASQTRAGLARLVGGVAFGSLSNMMSKAKEHYHASKPAVEGMGTGAGTGAGGARAPARRGLAARLM
jgi:hypothetical protein